MACAHFSRREQARFCVIAQTAKAGADLGKSQIDVAFDVFEEDRSGLHLADDPRDLGPQVAGIVLPAAFAGEAERLAGITGREDMNAAAPCSAVEAAQIVPDRRWLHGLVFHPRHESGRSMGFPLDETHSAIGGLGDGKAKVKPAISGAEGQAEQGAAPIIRAGIYSHKGLLLRRLTGRSQEGSQASID